MAYNFQVNLGSVIDLLSNHLYTGPQVYVRELLQNSTDAISARRQLDPHYEGRVHIEVHADDAPPTLVVTDNGIGLTEDEVHQFLATIGGTSKRADLLARRTDFIGQFGIGLLSCFLVSDEIVVHTRSAHAGAHAFEWRGRADGTYTLAQATAEVAVGTRVALSARRGSESFFEAAEVERLARHYGGLLPYAVTFSAGGAGITLNERQPPWCAEFVDGAAERAAYLEYGRELFGAEFLDYVPLRARAGDVVGVAFVLPYAPNLATKRTHRVYLKHMLVSEQAEGLLPDWAFFVKCVVNADDLRPTASREALYEDESLAAARAELGRCLRDYLIDLAAHDTERLRQLIRLHHLSLKALAVEDDELFRLFIDWLPFETNMGDLSMGDYRAEHQTIHYANNLDQFRQLSSVAAAQDICVINAVYAYDQQLIHKLTDLDPTLRIRRLDADSLTYDFAHLTSDEDARVADVLAAARAVVREFNCVPEVRRFAPASLPVLYVADADGAFYRAVEMSKEVAGALWSSVLDELTAAREREARLCFNYDNALVYKVTRLEDEGLRRLVIQALYLQALLLGHRPLRATELRLLNESFAGLIAWGVELEGGWSN